MCDSPHTMCLCCIYIGSWPTKDFWYTIKKARYQPVTGCTYCPVLVSCINFNIINLTPKSTPFLVQSGKYGVTNTADITTNVFYIIQFISEAYMIQNSIKIDRQIISAGELFFKAQYIWSMQKKPNWYWKQHSLQNNTTFQTHTILHPCLDFFRITDAQDIHKTVWNRIQEKIHTKTSYLYDRFWL